MVRSGSTALQRTEIGRRAEEVVVSDTIISVHDWLTEKPQPRSQLRVR